MENDLAGATDLGSELNSPLIVVVIPAYCVAKQIEKVLSQIPSFVSHIVVVNDCSTDDTAEVVRKCKDQRIHLINLETNQGVGGATLRGYAAAVELGASVIVKIDGDDQMDPAYLADLIWPVVSRQADYCKGNRFMHPEELKSMPWVRRLGNIGLSFLTKLASGYWDIFDPTNGYTAISAAIVPLLDRAHLDRRYFFESSLLIELGVRRAVVKDVYMPARYGLETSALSEVKALWSFPFRLLAGTLRRITALYFVRDFGIFSVLLVTGIVACLAGTLWGAYHWGLSIAYDKPASTGTVMLAVLPIILGVQFLLQAIFIDIQNVPAKSLQQLSSSRAMEKLMARLGGRHAQP